MHYNPVKNVTLMYFLMTYLTAFGLVRKWDQIRTGNPIIFLGNPMENPWLDLVQNPYHVPAWKTNKTCVNDLKSSWNSVSISIKLPGICDMEFPWDPDQMFYREFIKSHFQPLLRNFQRFTNIVTKSTKIIIKHQ